jgi:ABC-type ATPase with predicted acetyltransferase domain
MTEPVINADGMTVYKVDIRFKTRVQRSPRVLEVAEAFGIGLEEKDFVVFDNQEILARKGDIIYITGQSGGGKSVLLRELSRQMGENGQSIINLDAIEFQDKPLIDQIGTDTDNAIMTLGLAGINDAYLWVRKPSELSDGQRYRFRLAKAMELGADVWVADEFLAVLDRTSAKVIAYSVQKAARRAGATVIVATTHTDMVDDLYPDLKIEKRFREKVQIDHYEEAAKAAAGAVVTREQINALLLGDI